MKTLTSVKGILFLIISSFICKAGFSQNCTVNAGVATTLCQGQEIRMIGNIGGPTMSGTIAWSVVSQPGAASVVFANPSSLLTSGGIASIPGTYIFRLSATCGNGIAAQNDVTYTVVENPPIPTQTGTSFFNCYDGSPITVSGTAPGPGISAKWTVMSGPSGVFGSSGSSTTTFTPIFPEDQCSDYPVDITLLYTLSNSNGCQSSVAKVYSFSRNYGLAAKAVPSSVCGTATSLKGSCPGTGTAAWTLVSKPPGAPDPVFDNASSYITGVAGLVSGSYIFRYTITGDCSPGSVDITVTVLGTSALTSPAAGADQYFCIIPGTVSLNGNTPAVGETATWTQIGGTGTTIANPTNPNTSVSGLTDAGAPYFFSYNITNGGCALTDTVAIYKIPDLSLVPRPISICTGSFSSQDRGPQFGNYLFNGLDTVKINITYLSGPAGAVAGAILTNNIVNFGGNDMPGVASGSFFSPGESTSWSVFGTQLYYDNAFADPYTSAYFLSNRFFLSTPGAYRFRISYTTKCNTYETEVDAFKGLVGFGVNAGTDLLLGCGVTATNLAGNLPDGEGQWITIQKPAGATNPINGANQHLQTPGLSGLISGTYVFRYSHNNGPVCIDNFYDDVRLVISSTPPPTPNAGADKTTCAGSITLNGSAIPDNAGALWSVVSPSGSGVTFNDPTIANPQAIGLQPSTVYTFRYTFSNGCGTSFEDVVVTTSTSINPAKPTLSSFMSDCESTAGAIPYFRSLTINHPAFTVGGGIDSAWTIISYPAVISHTITPLDPTSTMINLDITQVYAVSIIYKLTNTTCAGEASSDTLSLAFKGESDFFVTAGQPQQLCAINSYPAMATLTGSASSLPVLWSSYISSNGQAATITTPGGTSTAVSLPANGMYRFRYQILSPLDPACPNLGESFTQITTSSPGSPAFAGNDKSFCAGNGTTNLEATPLVSGTGQWQIHDVLSGATPTIATPSSATSQIVFSQSGSVVLKWNSYGTIAECGPSSSDLVTVTYYAPANAGNDQQLCKSTTTNLNALSPSPATGVWTKVSGPSATIADPNSPQTVVTGLTSGSYVFRWSVTAPSLCSSTDDINIVVSDITEVANAGFDFPSCSGGNNTIRLNATNAPGGFTGTWALVNKPTGAATGSFSSINSPNSTYSGVSMPGKYSFSWTIGNGVCSSTDFVEVTAGATGCTLPVVLNKFNGTINFNCNVELVWQSESEQNVLKFMLERSEDGVSYSTISEIAAFGNSTSARLYGYVDKQITANEYFYRLKMVDRDGSYKYSGVIRMAIPCFNANSLSVLPNPVQKGNSFKVKIITDQNITKGVFTIKNIVGQTIQTYPIVVRAGTSFIEYPSGTLSAGTYLINLSENNKLISNCKIVIQ